MLGLISGILVIIAGIVATIIAISCDFEKKYSIIPVIAGFILGIVFIILGCTVSVSTGHTGVVTTFGRVEDFTLEAGFHFKAPWHSVISMDNRVQKATVELSCFSADIQEVEMKYTLNYQIDKNNAQEIYRTIGSDYYHTIIEPNISEAAKVITAKYTAEQLVQTRTELAVGIEENLTEALAAYNIKVSSTAIEDLDFTDSFTTAVEAKQVAEQKKKQAIIEQEQARLQAENEKAISKTQAEAAAEVAKIQAEADMEVAKISADSAEYQGKKEAAIRLQALASVNGWTVISNETTGINELYKADGTKVSAVELSEGVERLIEYYYTQTWNGTLPETYMGNESISSIILDTKTK
jgi:regulator of protease activity HflC (stomatin/prohibitin superfamily)